MNKIVTLLVLFGVTACSLAPSKEQLARANYGQRPDQAVAVGTIRAVLNKTLIDPDSLKLACNDARKGWVDGMADSRTGWVIYCEVNAKNRLGGYTGAQPHVYLFRGNSLVDMRMDHVNSGVNYDYVD